MPNEWLKRGMGIGLLALAVVCASPGRAHAQMAPYFTAIGPTMQKGNLMLMTLSDYQLARSGPDFLTYMGMAEYGVTNRWTVGFMAEGQRIGDLPETFGGVRFNTYVQLLPHDHLLHLTLYGEYEDLNQASLYKMEISGFGGEDLTAPLPVARNRPARTLEQRVIMYHDWGRNNLTLNFVSEANLENYENDFGYVWGYFRKAEWNPMGAEMGSKMQMGSTPAPSPFSPRRLGYGVEMMGGLGSDSQFGFDWPRQQQYLGPVVTYMLSPDSDFRLEPTFGLSDVSDRFVLRIAFDYTMRGLLGRIRRNF